MQITDSWEIRAQCYKSTEFEQTLSNLNHKSTVDPEGGEETESDTKTLSAQLHTWRSPMKVVTRFGERARHNPRPQQL